MRIENKTSTTNDCSNQVSDNFREAMRRLAASVMIITGRDTDGTPHGMVASSVISVSMDPPSMLIAVNRSASLHPVLMRSKRFCINLLSDAQSDLLKPFSTSALRDQRFKSDQWNDTWSTDSARLPWLPDASASFHCAVDFSTDYGTHSLFIGRVLHVNCAPHVANDRTTTRPLVWLAGQQASLSPLSA